MSMKDSAENVTPAETGEGAGVRPRLNESGIRAMQGDAQDAPHNSACKGSDFEAWAHDNVFHGKGKRVVIRPEDNNHLDELGDGVGITKTRRISDVYLNKQGEIWELKAGYENNPIDRNQLYEYALMEQAGGIQVREDGKLKTMPVRSVNYLFDSKAGAAANEVFLRGYATTWYVDSAEQVQLFKP